MQKPESQAELTLLYMGMQGPSSSMPLHQITTAGWRVSAVVSSGPVPLVPAAPGPVIPVRRDDSAVTLDGVANTAGIPIHYARGADDAATLAFIAGVRPDVILVACYPWRIPASILELASNGVYNLHPSMLPAYRGPTPLFWQFYHGERDTGVTLHEVSEQLDSGDIVLQRAVELPDGVSGPQASTLLARHGAELMLEALGGLTSGSLSRTPQDEARASYQSWPGQTDFRLSIRWPVQRAWNFIRGTREWGRPYYVELDDRTWLLESVSGFSMANEQPEAYTCKGRDIEIGFRDGILHARLAAELGNL